MTNANINKKPVTFVYLTKENHNWVRKTAVDLNQTYSYVVDRCVESFRTSKPVILEEKIPEYLMKAARAQQRKLKRIVG